MPRFTTRSPGAVPRRPLTAARPVRGETHSTFPPSDATWRAKSAGTDPLNATMWRPVRAGTTPPCATVENCSAGRATGSDGTRASRSHATTAISPSVANRNADEGRDTGRLGSKGDGKHVPHSGGQQVAPKTVTGLLPPRVHVVTGAGHRIASTPDLQFKEAP